MQPNPQSQCNSFPITNSFLSREGRILESYGTKRDPEKLKQCLREKKKSLQGGVGGCDDLTLKQHVTSTKEKQRPVQKRTQKLTHVHTAINL